MSQAESQQRTAGHQRTAHDMDSQQRTAWYRLTAAHGMVSTHSSARHGIDSQQRTAWCRVHDTGHDTRCRVHDTRCTTQQCMHSDTGQDTLCRVHDTAGCTTPAALRTPFHGISCSRALLQQQRAAIAASAPSAAKSRLQHYPECVPQLLNQGCNTILSVSRSC
jgi:hypothetical protein